MLRVSDDADYLIYVAAIVLLTIAIYMKFMMGGRRTGYSGYFSDEFR